MGSFLVKKLWVALRSVIYGEVWVGKQDGVDTVLGSDWLLINLITMNLLVPFYEVSA